jgi:hypothetical protein
MKTTILAATLTLLALSACTSLPEIAGPYARSTKGATQTDAAPDRTEQSPFPAVTDEGRF